MTAIPGVCECVCVCDASAFIFTNRRQTSNNRLFFSKFDSNLDLSSENTMFSLFLNHIIPSQWGI